MQALLANFRDRFRELALDFLWRQWSALGVAGHTRGDDNWIIDPEALLLITTTLGRYDPRLFDESLDWLGANGPFINLQRLQNLGRNLGQRGVLEVIAAHLSKRAANLKWRALARKNAKPTALAPLFPDAPVIGEPDELFARHGWRRGPLILRQLGQPPDPHRATNLLFKLRALFGLQARAEVMAYLLAFESGHPREMAERLAYFPRTLQTALNDMARSGHVMTRRGAHEKKFWLRREEWRFLATWPPRDGNAAPEFPRWVDWAPFFGALEAVWQYLDRPWLHDATPGVQAIELRACLDKLSPAWVRENIKTPPGATGAAYLESVINDFTRILS
jgi:hypothetical protein